MDYSLLSNYCWLLNFGIIQYNAKDGSFKNEFWFPNDKVESCWSCNKTFSLFSRRHHCKICGIIFCDSCLNKTIEEKLLEETYYIKVCEKCFQNYEIFNKTITNNLIVDRDNIYIKTAYYCDNILVKEYKNYEFSGFKDLKLEKDIIFNLNNKYFEMVKIMIFNVLYRNLGENLTIKWNIIIENLVLKVIEFIKPSSKYLNDTLNIMDYIKIKTIEAEYENKIIKGFIMKKRDENCKIINQIKKPKILIIETENDFIEFNKDNIEKINLQKEIFEIFQNKIIKSKCDLILYNKKFPNYLNFSKNINFVYGIHPKNLKKIARSTNTFIIPSFYFFGPHFFYGKCKDVYVETIKDKNNNIIKEILVFENSEKLFCSIILSNGEKKELKLLKKLLTEIIIPTAWDLYLQKCFIYDLNLNFNLDNISKFSNNIKENISNFSNLFIQPSILEKYKTIENNIGKVINPYINGFDTSVIEITKNDDYNKSIFLKMKMYLENKKNDSNLNSTFYIEKYIQKYYPKVCSDLSYFSRIYYDRNQNDKPFGMFLYKLMKYSNLICQKCQNKYQNHFYYLFKKNIKLKISILNDNDIKLYENIIHLIPYQSINVDLSLLNEKDYYNVISKTEIYMFGFCKECNTIVTPIIKLSNDFFNYSLTKILERIMLNNCLNFNLRKEFNSKNIANINCKHNNKSIKRLFINNINCFEFDLDDFGIYSIIPLNCDFNSNDFSIYKCSLEFYKKDSYELSSYILNKLKSCYEKEIQYYMKIQDKKNENVFINDMIKNITKYYYLFDKIKSDFIEEYLNKSNESINTYIKLIIYIYQIYIFLGKMKLIINRIHSIMLKINLLNELENNNIPQSDKSYYFKIDNITIDFDKNYSNLLNFISYFDEYHNNYSCELIENDLSSYIAYSLSSDKYINFINKGNLKMTLIYCNRNKKENENVNHNLKETDNVHKLFEKKYIFDLSNLEFFNPKNPEENNLTILEKLKKELILDNQENSQFQYSFNYNLKKLLSSPNPIKNNEKFNDFSEEIESLNQLLYEKRDKFKSINENLFKSLKEKNINFDNIYENGKKPYSEQILFTKKYPKANVIIYFPKQFEALRTIYCETYNEFILSISKSKNWIDVSGGKSKASFYKSIDDKYILKCVSKFEFDMFIQSADKYFSHMEKFLFQKIPSLLAKILGIYEIHINQNELTEEIYYIILMENIHYQLDESIFEKKKFKTYDLKGSKIKRYINNRNNDKNIRNQVLLDTNFIEDFYFNPIIINKNDFDLFIKGLNSDTLFLCNLNVVDYSLLLVVNKESTGKNKVIKFGIIDYIRKYTWDKKIEYYSKKVLNGIDPTITDPKEYRKRFLENMNSYFISI